MIDVDVYKRQVQPVVGLCRLGLVLFDIAEGCDFKFACVLARVADKMMIAHTAAAYERDSNLFTHLLFLLKGAGCLHLAPFVPCMPLSYMTYTVETVSYTHLENINSIIEAIK